MKNEEFIKLKNSIARKSVIKILLYSLGAIILFSVLIDGVYNDELADSLARVNRDIYYWCVANKIILLGITYLVIFAIISFFVIRNTSNNMVEIIKAMDQIIKEPEKEVKLSNDLQESVQKHGKDYFDVTIKKCLWHTACVENDCEKLCHLFCDVDNAAHGDCEDSVRIFPCQLIS